MFMTNKFPYLLETGQYYGLPNPLQINLGSNDHILPGYFSCDIDPVHDPVFLTDLTQPWPWPDCSVDAIYARDVFEHLPDKRFTMNELWRVLKVGGTAIIQVPHATDGDGGHCDPTHRSFWTCSDFEYYVPGVAERERFRNSSYYGVCADFRITNLNSFGHIPTQRFGRKFGGYVVEIQVQLEKVEASSK